MSDITIVHGNEIEVEWDYRGSNPKVRYGRYHQAVVDPCPAYPHDKSVVWDAISEVVERWPAPVPVTVFILNHEEIGRTNGHSNHARRFYDDPPVVDEHHIVLSAKRVPIHPAMTRYLMAHEYGHHVQWWVQQQMGFEYSADDAFESEVYAPLRGMEHVDAAPGKWHVATGEVFACDFRLLITGMEAEFWPHAPIPPPAVRPLLSEWWEERRVQDYSMVARPEPPTVDSESESLCG